MSLHSQGQSLLQLEETLEEEEEREEQRWRREKREQEASEIRNGEPEKSMGRLGMDGKRGDEHEVDWSWLYDGVVSGKEEVGCGETKRVLELGL